MESIDYEKLANAIVKLQQTTQGATLVSAAANQPVDTAVTGTVPSDQAKLNIRSPGVGFDSRVKPVGGSVKDNYVEVGGGYSSRDGGKKFTTLSQLLEHERVVAGENALEDVGASDKSEESVVSGGGVGFVSDKTKRAVVFGGELYGEGGVRDEEGEKGFYADFVRGSHATGLFKQLRKLGILLPKPARAEVAYCSYTAGTMPAIATYGKTRLRGLAVLGDAAITMHLITKMYHNGDSAESMQTARSKLTSDKHFAKVMERLGLLKCVSFAPGVDPHSSKAGATAFEAIIGVMSIYMPVSVVANFLSVHKVFV